MNRTLRSAVFGLAVTATALVPAVSSAEHLYPRRDRFFEERVDGHHYKRRHHRHHRVIRRNDDALGAAIALGIVGLAVGAMIASQPEERYLPRRHVQPVDPGYYPPTPARNPDVVYYDDASGLEPWTDAWSYACHQRYRTFDDRTGTYRGFDGKRHFCVID